MSKKKTVPAYVADAYLKALTIYGYDTMNHEKYCFSVDHFIDNYKEFAKDDFFWIFHSKEERDSFALDSYREELNCDFTYGEAKEYLDGLKEIDLDKAVSS
jgi:hypothetical protein|tara:strand:- start:1565 stop:1867 length:303 start_codon:yes stop_codon:yes gene_type:complete